MGTRTVRLDEDSERALDEIRSATGMSVSGVLKRGLAAVREKLGTGSSATPYEIYSSLDLGPGGYSRAPARQAKKAVRAILRKRRR
ncbi:MAG: hypothetical protein ACREQJ_10400 [Candidatus Binatia bacterium]